MSVAHGPVSPHSHEPYPHFADVEAALEWSWSQTQLLTSDLPYASTAQADAEGKQCGNKRPQPPRHLFPGGQATAPSTADVTGGHPPLLALVLPLPRLLVLLIYINYLSPIIHPAVPTVICE